MGWTVGYEERAGHYERVTEVKRTLEHPGPKGHAKIKKPKNDLRLLLSWNNYII